MAFGAIVALARRVREGGSWLVRISLAQTGRWLVGRGEVPEAELKDVPKEFTAAELNRWSMTSDTPVGRLHHLAPVLRLSETPRAGRDRPCRSGTTRRYGRRGSRSYPGILG